MTINDFWNIIDQARPESRNIGEFNQNLDRSLEPLPDEDLLYFDYFFKMYECTIVASPNRLIRSVLSLVYGGKHKYNTYDFAAWLILQGKSHYLVVLHDADRLADTETTQNYCSGNLKGRERESPGQRYLADRIYSKRNRIGIRTFEKTTKKFALKADTEWQKIGQQELNSPTFQSNRNWILEDLVVTLPNTYQRYICVWMYN